LAKRKNSEAPHYVVFSTLLPFHPFFGTHTLLNTLFSNTRSLWSSLNVRDEVSHPYGTTGKIIVLYILTFKFFDSRQENRRFWIEWYQALPEFNFLLISS
jgi:hypothetical protein